MKLRTLLLTSAITCFAATGAAYAVDDAVIDEISGALAADGFTKIHLRHGRTWVEVEAWGPAGKVERRYDGNGEMLRERLHAGESMPVVDAVGDDGETPIGDRIQTRAQTGAGDGSGHGDGAGEHDGSGDGGERKQTRAGKNS